MLQILNRCQFPIDLLKRSEMFSYSRIEYFAWLYQCMQQILTRPSNFTFNTYMQQYKCSKLCCVLKPAFLYSAVYIKIAVLRWNYLNYNFWITLLNSFCILVKYTVIHHFQYTKKFWRQQFIDFRHISPFRNRLVSIFFFFL